MIRKLKEQSRRSNGRFQKERTEKMKGEDINQITRKNNSQSERSCVFRLKETVPNKTHEKKYTEVVILKCNSHNKKKIL